MKEKRKALRFELHCLTCLTKYSKTSSLRAHEMWCGKAADRREAARLRMKRKWKDEEWGKKQRNLLFKLSQELAKDPKERERRKETAKENWERLEYRKAASERTKSQWKDSNFKQIRSDSATTQGIKEKEIRSERQKKKWLNVEYQEKMKETRRKTWDAENRQKLSESTKQSWKDEKFRNTIVEAVKKNWRNPDYIKKQMKARRVSPNFAELKLKHFLDAEFPNTFRFVGDGQFILAGKCPDFICTDKKLVIELFGEIFHTEDEGVERTKLFKDHGFETLIIWSRELKDMERVTNRVNMFLKLRKAA